MRLLPQCLYIIVKKLSEGTSCVDMNKAMDVKNNSANNEALVK